jgi:hypothetical protein
MMKNLLGISFLFISLICNQDVYCQKIKGFELEQCDESDLYIAVGKKSSGLYNKNKAGWEIVPSTVIVIYQIQLDSTPLGYAVNENTSKCKCFKSEDEGRIMVKDYLFDFYDLNGEEMWENRSWNQRMKVGRPF